MAICSATTTRIETAVADRVIIKNPKKLPKQTALIAHCSSYLTLLKVRLEIKFKDMI